MTNSDLPFAQIRRILGAPQIQVEVAGRVWKLHLVDGLHDRPTVELIFEHIESGLPAVRLVVDEGNLSRAHVSALLQSYLSENPPASMHKLRI